MGNVPASIPMIWAGEAGEVSGRLSNNPSLNKPSVLCPRAAESSACPTIHPKQAKTEKAVAQDHAENGECPAESRESKEFQIAAAEAMAAATPTAKSSSGKDAVQQGGSQASLQEEDPERMKHSKIRAWGYAGSGAQRGVSHGKGWGSVPASAAVSVSLNVSKPFFNILIIYTHPQFLATASSTES